VFIILGYIESYFTNLSNFQNDLEKMKAKVILAINKQNDIVNREEASHQFELLRNIFEP